MSEGLCWIYLNGDWLLKRDSDGMIVESVTKTDHPELWRYGGQTFHLSENAKHAAMYHAQNPPRKWRS